MSIIAQLCLTESAELDFGVEVSGTDNSMDIRFIIEGPQYGIVCACSEEDGIVTALIPKLHGVLPPGTYESRLEIVVDGKYFKPLIENIEFTVPVIVGASVISRPITEGVKARSTGVRIGNRQVKPVEESVAPVSASGPKNTMFRDYVNTAKSSPAPNPKKERLAEMYGKIRQYEQEINRIKGEPNR